MWDRIINSFSRNPTAWILFGLLALALYGSYQRGKELDTVCQAIPWPVATRVHPQNSLEAAQLICVERNSN
jgi:hypothetical protein